MIIFKCDRCDFQTYILAPFVVNAEGILVHTDKDTANRVKGVIRGNPQGNILLCDQCIDEYVDKVIHKVDEYKDLKIEEFMKEKQKNENNIP